MLETIGKRVKKLRKDLNMGQKEINVSQTHLSQIETERITKPKQNILNKIAKSFGITLDELIEGTDWTADKKNVEEYFISPASYEVSIDNNGYITYENSKIPKYSENGDINEFCPHTGSKLIKECKNCGREIENSKHGYCMGCGSLLVKKWEVPEEYASLITPESMSDIEYCNANLQQILMEKGEVVHWFTKLKDCPSSKKWNLIVNVRSFGHSYKPEPNNEENFENDKVDQLEYMVYAIQLCEEIEKYLRAKLKYLKEEHALKPFHERLYKGTFMVMQNLIAENQSISKSMPDIVQAYEVGEQRDSYLEINRKAIESNEKSIDKLADILKSFDPDGDHSEIEQLFKTIKSENKDLEKNILEDGVSKSDAAKKADRNNNTKQNKKE